MSRTPPCDRVPTRHWDDPAGIVETAFCRGDGVLTDPETVIIAWLAVLPGRTDTALAAASVLARLARTRTEPLSPRQWRLLDLLGHIGSHHRRASGR